MNGVSDDLRRSRLDEEEACMGRDCVKVEVVLAAELRRAELLIVGDESWGKYDGLKPIDFCIPKFGENVWVGVVPVFRCVVESGATGEMTLRPRGVIDPRRG